MGNQSFKNWPRLLIYFWIFWILNKFAVTPRPTVKCYHWFAGFLSELTFFCKICLHHIITSKKWIRKLSAKLALALDLLFSIFNEFTLPYPQDPLWSVTIGWLASSVSYICCFRQQVNVQKTECAVALRSQLVCALHNKPELTPLFSRALYFTAKEIWDRSKLSPIKPDPCKLIIFLHIVMCSAK